MAKRVEGIPVPVIPMNEPISFEDWAAGLEFRRKICEAAMSASPRRLDGSDDGRLRRAFRGRRAPEEGSAQ